MESLADRIQSCRSEIDRGMRVNAEVNRELELSANIRGDVTLDRREEIVLPLLSILLGLPGAFLISWLVDLVFDISAEVNRWVFSVSWVMGTASMVAFSVANALTERSLFWFNAGCNGEERRVLLEGILDDIDDTFPGLVPELPPFDDYQDNPAVKRALKRVS